MKSEHNDIDIHTWESSGERASCYDSGIVQTADADAVTVFALFASAR